MLQRQLLLLLLSLPQLPLLGRPVRLVPSS